MAVVSTVALNQKSHGGKGDVKQTIEICSLVIEDHADLVVKALSWALRELSKVDKNNVANFIEQHKNKLHKRVVREVNNKLTTGRKIIT